MIRVKAMVDTEKNKVVFAESDEDFADVLFSFLTIPMGTIVSLTCDKEMTTGCMNNLYESVQNLNVKYFRTQECKKMLLYPVNGVPSQCMRLKIRTDYSIDDYSYFSCERDTCTNSSSNKMLYQNQTICDKCRRYTTEFERNPVKGGAFLKRLIPLVISDDLQLMHPTSSKSFSFLSDLGGVRALELREFRIGQEEVLNLLKNSLVSREALTHTLLQKDETNQGNVFRGRVSFSLFEKNCVHGGVENGKKIDVKLFVSKSKKIVCFAEVAEDFVDLIFSFLTVPLGHLLKQMLDGAIIDGCVDNLYKSIAELDVKYFNSCNEKEMLLNPKIAPKFGYDNQLISVEEVSCDVYFDNTSTAITLKDPKIPTQKEDASNGGFIVGPTMFTVTDNLSVVPISVATRLTILSKLDVLMSDVQERVVHVGNNEAVRLLLASFGSESALTDTFLKP
ncbi:hypothetical protein M5689_014008 [Euphorbia peplus]|nr:hypothetical protein M5689_014008 [Euphorbia peplus]